MSVALDSPRGVALGDCFGETWFFRPAEQVAWMLKERVVPQGPWRWTDDTAMALSVYRMLVLRGEVVQTVAGAIGLPGVRSAWMMVA